MVFFGKNKKKKEEEIKVLDPNQASKEVREEFPEDNPEGAGVTEYDYDKDYAITCDACGDMTQTVYCKKCANLKNEK